MSTEDPTSIHYRHPTFEERREALERDAARYRFLRDSHWSESSDTLVVTRMNSVRLGSSCPSGKLLDAAIDEAIAKGASDARG